MTINVNCTYNDRGAWCTNKNVPRSMFGIGARCCPLFDNSSTCTHQQKIKRPTAPMPGVPTRCSSQSGASAMRPDINNSCKCSCKCKNNIDN